MTLLIGEKIKEQITYTQIEGKNLPKSHNQNVQNKNKVQRFKGSRIWSVCSGNASRNSSNTGLINMTNMKSLVRFWLVAGGKFSIVSPWPINAHRRLKLSLCAMKSSR